MPTPQISHEVDIHLTDAAGTALSSSNKLEETSEVNISGAHTTVERQNLNSDGHSRQSVTWHSYSGSMTYQVARDSTVQSDAVAAAAAGTSVWIHFIHTPDALTGEVKGTKYEIVFESHEEKFAGPELVGGTASFKVNGAPVDILAT